MSRFMDRNRSKPTWVITKIRDIAERRIFVYNIIESTHPSLSDILQGASTRNSHHCTQLVALGTDRKGSESWPSVTLS
jgi:hypothetical protein